MAVPPSVEVAMMAYKHNKNRKTVLLAAMLVAGSTAHAMQSMDDDGLSDVSAQAGLTFIVSNPTAIGGASTNVQWQVDPTTGTCTTCTTTYAGTFIENGFQINGIGNQGQASGASNTSGPFSVTTTADVGANSTGTPGIALTESWSRLRVQDSMNLQNSAGTASATNFGNTAIDSSGTFTLANTGGLLSSSSTNSSLRLLHLTVGSPQLGLTSPGSYAQIYYRQGTGAGIPELILDKVYLDAGFDASGMGGIFGSCVIGGACGQYPAAGGFASSAFASSFAAAATNQSGVLISTPHLNFNLIFQADLRSSPSAATGIFTTKCTAVAGSCTAGDVEQPMFTYGFGGIAQNNVAPASGGFNNAELLVSGGGLWSTPALTGTYNPDVPAGRSQGLNLAFHATSYDSNFNWILGPGNGVGVVEFGGWTTLNSGLVSGNPTYALNAPNITVDVLNTTGTDSGPGGLCFGAPAYGGATTCSSATYTRINGQQVGSSQTVKPQFLNMIPPNAGTSTASTALALVVRDLSLQAYSTSVTLLQDLNSDGQYSGSSNLSCGASCTVNVSEVQSAKWALIYTLGTVDGNVYLYPTNGSGGNGLTADVLFTIQSFNKPASTTAGNTYGASTTSGCPTATTNTLCGNTNFMIGDTSSKYQGTGSNLGIGLLQANVLVGMRQTSINLTSSGINLSTNTANANGGGARVDVNGMFGGGTIPSMTNCSAAPSVSGTSCQINLFTLDLNAEMTAASLTISPQTSNGYSYLSFNGAVTLGSLSTSSGGGNGFGSGNGTYITLGEPTSSAAERGANVTLGGITGQLGIANSRFFLIPASDATDTSTATGSPDGLARLQIAETMNALTAITVGSISLQAGNGGTPLSLGTMVIPQGGSWYSSMELKRQGLTN